MNNEFQKNNNKETYGNLPIWNLNDLYSSPNSKKLRDDFILFILLHFIYAYKCLTNRCKTLS